MNEQQLAGGNMEPVVRVGDTVRRIAGPWTQSVHQLLDAYAEHGIPEVPEALGIDDQGREILTFIEGDVMATLSPPERWSIELLEAAAEVLRDLHEASIGMIAKRHVWRQFPRQPIEVICHNDYADYNLIVHEGDLVGVIDFDYAGPGPRIRDIAYLAYRLVPYVSDGGTYEPERDGTREERLTRLIAAYGIDYTHQDVEQAIVQYLEGLARFSEKRAEELGKPELMDHAAMYDADARKLRRKAIIGDLSVLGDLPGRVT